MSWGKFFAILKLTPAIIGMVKEVEQALPGSGQGAAKLNLVLNTVNAAASAVPEIQQHFAAGELDQAVKGIVDGTVHTLNTSGVFKK